MQISRSFTRPEGFKAAAEASGLDVLYTVWERNLVVEAEVLKVTEIGGEQCWELELDGAKGLVPFSESGLEYPGQMDQFTGSMVFVKVKGIDKDSGIAALSRQEALADMRKSVMERLSPGQVVDAIVRGVGRNTVYLDVGGGVIGEMPRKMATFSQKLQSLRKVFNLGQQLRVKVMEVDSERNKIVVSRTELLPDPWEKVDFKRRDRISGTVVRVHGDKAFVEFKDGVVALANFSLLDRISPGDRVRGVVTRFDPEKKLLRLKLTDRLA
ncbi:S1 RNA-binding domain-containing protein [Desulfotruncus alcoholivorax]|uniref:S1 RNA-binding domain-containing protein n=1 Tax=Desulfotruncus alcoholivorax TaxID=265477 RepID=UPI000403CE6B|nr:S1 RNA-binding domain-containing protein [Desulfotruncus alcoholivorax]